MMNEPTDNPRITREARLYGFKELARRAGVTAEFYRSWRIELGAEEITVYPQPGEQKRIFFKNASPTFLHELPARKFHSARASWMQSPPELLRTLVPDFVIPFSPESQHGKRPLFSPVDGNCVECTHDLPLSVLLLLSRWEETLAFEPDVHGEFPPSASVAFRDGFLTRPIVDEYGLALEQALLYLFPTWRPVERRLRVKLSHDIDEIGLPFNPRSTIGHTLRRRKPWATARDLLSWLPGLNPAYLQAVRQMVQLSLERDLDSAVYWKASPPGYLDSGYDPRHPKVQEVITWLHDRGVETGVHPGYSTFRCPEALRREVEILREALGDRLLGGRQHYLRWCPDAWYDWETCGLAYDSSVGYNDHIGFRAGTCIPYRPWLFPLNREAHLLEIPLLVMDVTLLQFMKLTHAQSLAAISECLVRCGGVGGVFTLLWHNNIMLEPRYGGLYERILDKLVGHGKLDWRAPSNDLY